jgi:hypothetical protein
MLFIIIGGAWTLILGVLLGLPATLRDVLVRGDRGEGMFALIWTGIPVLPGVLMLLAGIVLFWLSRTSHARSER